MAVMPLIFYKLLLGNRIHKQSVAQNSGSGSVEVKGLKPGKKRTQKTHELIVEMEGQIAEKEQIIKDYCTVKAVLPMLNALIVEVPVEKAHRLYSLSGVKTVYQNTNISAQMNNARRTLKADTVHQRGYTGKGISIAFLDTGISMLQDFTKPRSRVIKFKDFIGKTVEPYDDNGHGTHVAAIAAGNGMLSGGKFCGIAPEAGIVSVKVLDANGMGKAVSALTGIQWVLDNKEVYNIRIINLSVGSSEVSTEDPLVKAVNAAWDAGIVVVAAAGNNGPKGMTVTAPGNSRKIITVGASDDNRKVQIWGNTMVNFSGRGPTDECIIKPDVVAPGSDIISLKGINKENQSVIENHYVKLSGTSMSTPMVSGAIALLLEKHPSMTPDEVKLYLKNCAINLNYPQNQQGWGLLDIERLLAN